MCREAYASRPAAKAAPGLMSVTALMPSPLAELRNAQTQ